MARRPKAETKVETKGQEVAPDDPDAAILQGHPAAGGSGTIQESAPSQGTGGVAQDDGSVEITVGGKTFRVAKDLADAVNSQPQQAPQPTDLERALAALTQRPAPAPSPAPAPEQNTELNELLFSNPAEAIRRISQSVREDVWRETQQRLATERSQADFWSQFYGANPELRKYETLVHATLSDNWSTVSNLSVSQGASKLAELTKRNIVNLLADFGQPTPAGKNGTTTIEAPAGRQPQVRRAPEGAGEEALPGSLSEAIKLRRRERLATARK